MLKLVAEIGGYEILSNVTKNEILDSFEILLKILPLDWIKVVLSSDCLYT